MAADRYSVIIPAYNAGPTIEHAIRSAMDQAPAPLEVLVGDDGSTDDTAKQAEALGAKVIRLPKENGSIARNRAVEAAKGDLLFFLDADDWWKPGKVRAHLEVWAGGSPSFVVDVATKVSHRGIAIGRLGAGPEGEVAWERYLDWRTWTSGSSFSIPRERYMALGGFREQLVSQQDVDFWVRTAHAFGPAWRIAESLTCYRMSPGGVSKVPRDVRENLEVLLRGWPFASPSQKREFWRLMTLTAAGFSTFPQSLQYMGMAGWPVWRLKFWRALARSLRRREAQI